MIISIIIAIFWTVIKTVSYGVWEIKRKNTKGGIVVMLCAVITVFLFARFLGRFYT